MTIFDRMNASELEAFTAELHSQINRGAGAKVEFEDVKRWIASRKKEAEACSESPFSLINLI